MICKTSILALLAASTVFANSCSTTYTFTGTTASEASKYCSSYLSSSHGSSTVYPTYMSSTLSLNPSAISSACSCYLGVKSTSVTTTSSSSVKSTSTSSSVQTISTSSIKSTSTPSTMLTCSSCPSASTVTASAITVTQPAVTQTASTVTLPASTVTLPASTVTLPASIVTAIASTITQPAVTLPASIVTSSILPCSATTSFLIQYSGTGNTAVDGMYADIEQGHLFADGTYEFGIASDERLATTFYLSPLGHLYATDQCEPALIDAQTDPTETIFFRTSAGDDYQYVTCALGGSPALNCHSSYGNTTFYCPIGAFDDAGVPQESVGIGAEVYPDDGNNRCTPIVLNPVQVPSYYSG